MGVSPYSFKNTIQFWIIKPAKTPEKGYRFPAQSFDPAKIIFNMRANMVIDNLLKSFKVIRLQIMGILSFSLSIRQL